MNTKLILLFMGAVFSTGCFSDESNFAGYYQCSMDEVNANISILENSIAKVKAKNNTIDAIWKDDGNALRITFAEKDGNEILLLLTQITESNNLYSIIYKENNKLKGEFSCSKEDKETINEANNINNINIYRELKYCDEKTISVPCLKAGIYYYKEQKYFKAFDLFKKACYMNSPISSDAEGCLLLGFLYEDGIGAVQNIVKAMHLYKKSCEMKEQRGCKHYSRIKVEGEVEEAMNRLKNISKQLGY